MLIDHTRFELGVNPQPEPGELSVLFSGEGDPVGGHAIGPAVHNYYLMHHVRSGRGSYSIGGQTFELVPGDTFIIFPGIPVRYEADLENPWQYQWVAFSGSAGGGLLQSIGVSPEQPTVHLGRRSRKASVLYRRIRHTFEHSGSEYPQLDNLQSTACLRLLLLELGNANRSRLLPVGEPLTEMERQVMHAIQLLSTQYTQPISVDQLARSCGYHRTHFSISFKKLAGCSPKQFVLKIRMERAKELLATVLPIEQVAASVGYTDPLYFSKQFHKWSGVSPSQYRKQLRGYVKAPHEQ